MTTVCVPCGRFFKIVKNGVTFQEGFGDGSGRPYKLWHADLFKCEGCGTEILSGAGRLPLAEHYQARYADIVARLSPLVFVDDCPGQYRAAPKESE